MLNGIAGPAARPAAYRSDIDGLRAIAVGAVVLFHAGVPGVSGGFVGVDVFFVISGLLIGSHVYSDVRRDRFSIGEFYRKRAKRILPALLVVLAFCYVAGVLLLSPGELTTLGRYSIATIFSGSNIFAWMTSNYFAASADQNPLLMTWSLGVEEQFYLIFPLIMLFLGKTRRKHLFLWTLAVTLLSLALCILATFSKPTAAFYLLPARAWELSLGFLVALYETGRNPSDLYAGQRFANLCSVAGLGAIVFSILRYDSHTAFPGYAAALPAVGAVLLLISPASWLNRVVLSSRPFTAIGQVSYSFYLWHWPLLSFAHILSDRPLRVGVGCGIVLAALGLATLSYWLVEQPFRRSKTPNPTLLLRYGALSALAMLPALVFVLSSGLSQRSPQTAAVEQALHRESHTCLAGATPDTSSPCMNRDDPRPAVAILGDSHAEAMAAAVGETANHSGYKLYKVVKTSCTPLLGAAPYLVTAAAEQQCMDFYKASLNLLAHDPQVRVVVITGYWSAVAVDHVGFVSEGALHRIAGTEESDRNFLEGLEKAITALKSAGKQVVLVLDVPIFRFDPARAMMSDATPLRRFLVGHFFHSSASRDGGAISDIYEREDDHAADIVRQAARAEGVPVYDPRQNLCADGKCVFREGDAPLYFDNQHVTAKGGERALAGFLLPPAGR